MRYTEETQRLVIEDFKNGLSMKDCALKHDVSLSIVYKWVSHLQKKDNTIKGRFQPLILSYEAIIESLISEEIPGLYEATDEEWEALCEKLERILFCFVEDVLDREKKSSVKIDKEGEDNEGSDL